MAHDLATPIYPKCVSCTKTDLITQGEQEMGLCGRCLVTVMYASYDYENTTNDMRRTYVCSGGSKSVYDAKT